MKEDFRNRLREFLAEHTTLTLATVAEDGRPQAAPLFYAETDELALIFISEKKARHSQNIARQKRVAATIYADGQQWQSITGLQLEGDCTELAGQTARIARAIYAAKYPFISCNKLLQLMFLKVTFYQIKPTWLRFIDNSLGFGHKEEFHWLP
jgi:uncharacterized protein YhbP (UPF0306 family)